MREVTIVNTIGISGNVNIQDLALQSIVYSDISSFRTAVGIRMAEKMNSEGFAVLFTTEDDNTEILAANGYIIYRSDHEDFNAEVDAKIIASYMGDRISVVFNTNKTTQFNKNSIIRALNDYLSEMSLKDIGFVYDGIENHQPRKRNSGNGVTIDNHANLMRRAKVSGSPVFYGAESPGEIPAEIANSCGTILVGTITNFERARAVAKITGVSAITRYAKDCYGVCALNRRDFYIFNPFTAAREATDGQGDMTISAETITRMAAVPRWLEDEEIQCGYNPQNPTPYDGEKTPSQVRFESELDEARTEFLTNQSATEATMRKVGRHVMKNIRHAASANDNARKKAYTGTRLEGVDTAVRKLQKNGVGSAADLFRCAKVLLNSSGHKMYDGNGRRYTANGIATRLLTHSSIDLAFNAGRRFAREMRKEHNQTVNGVVYAAAYYHAMQEDANLARAFNKDVFALNNSQPKLIDEMIKKISAVDAEMDKRAVNEARFKIIRDSWKIYQAINQDRLRLPNAA